MPVVRLRSDLPKQRAAGFQPGRCDDLEAWYDSPVLAGFEVYVSDFEGEWVETGLVDESGQPIMRFVPPSNLPVGFLWHDEEGNLRPSQDFEVF